MQQYIFLQLITDNDIPKWINAIPFEYIKKCIIYFYNYPLVLLGIFILIIILTFVIIAIVNCFGEVSFKDFTFKSNGKKTKRKDIDIKKIEKLLNGQESKINNLKQENTNLIKKNQTLINDMETIKTEYSKLRDSYRQLYKGAKEFEELYSGIKNAIYYLTSQNGVFDAAMSRNMKDDKAINEFYAESVYCLHQCLKDKGENVRISIMKYNKTNGLLQIVWKLGIFNCKFEELILHPGEGLAGLCLNLGKIIYVPNINMKQSEVAASDELLQQCLLGYIPSKNTNLTVSSLHIPVFVLGSVEGVINITSPREDSFIEEDELIAQLFAEKISRAWTIEKNKKKR